MKGKPQPMLRLGTHQFNSRLCRDASRRHSSLRRQTQRRLTRDTVIRRATARPRQGCCAAQHRAIRGARASARDRRLPDPREPRTRQPRPLAAMRESLADRRIAITQCAGTDREGRQQVGSAAKRSGFGRAAGVNRGPPTAVALLVKIRGNTDSKIAGT